MRVAYCPDDLDHDRIEHSLCGEEPILAVRSWERFEQHLAAARSGIALVECLSEGEEFHRLRRIRQRVPGTPLVLITKRDADNVRAIKDIALEEVVWIEEIEGKLAGAVQRAEGRGILSEIADDIRATRQLHPKLRQALISAIESSRPITAVDELAGSVSRDRRSLYYHWGQRVSVPSSFSVKTYLDWILLLRARILKSSHKTWESVADQLGIDVQHLTRVTRRLTGLRLRELGLLSARELAERFRRDLREAGFDMEIGA